MIPIELPLASPRILPAEWLAEPMRRLTTDLAEAIRLVRLGEYDEAKRVLKGEKK